MDKLQKWIKASNDFDDRNIARIKVSRYYHHLIDLESIIIFFTMPVLSIMLILLIIVLQDTVMTEKSGLWEEFMVNFVAWISGIVLIYWELFRILPFALKKDREAKKLRKEYKEKKDNN